MEAVADVLLSEGYTGQTTPWTAPGDTYKPLEYGQGYAGNRYFAEENCCGTDADLYGLVSNILQESDKMDACFGEESPATSVRHIWSSNSKDIFQQDIHAESKMHLNSSYLQSPGYEELQPKTELHRQINVCGFTDQWLPPSSSGETTLSSQVTSHKMQSPVLLNTLFTKNKAPIVRRDSDPDKLNMDPYSEYSSCCSSVTNKSKRIDMQEANKIAVNVQTVPVGEHDFYRNEFQPQQTGQRWCKDKVSNSQSYKYYKILAPNNKKMQYRKELNGECGEHGDALSTVEVQTQHSCGSRDCLDLNTEYFSHGDTFFGSLRTFFSFQNIHVPPNCQSEQPYYKFTSQSQMGVNVEGLRRGTGDEGLELQSTKSRKHKSLPSYGVSFQHSGACRDAEQDMNSQHEGEMKQNILNRNLDVMEGVNRFQRLLSGSRRTCMIHPGKTPQEFFFPNLYAVGENRQNKSCSNLNSKMSSSQSTVPHGSSVSLFDHHNALPDNEFNQFYPTANGKNGDIPLPGRTPTFTFNGLKKKWCGPLGQLHLHFVECYEQQRLLEKERKKTENVLAGSYPGMRISAVNSSSFPNHLPNTLHIHNLIVDLLNEITEVIGLLRKMEHLIGVPLHANINAALEEHLEVIDEAQQRMELIHSSNQQLKGPPRFREDNDILLLAAAVKNMGLATRKSRTALWSALQMTLIQI
uniref:Uncharacterized protein n=1 Tax=Lepisosteus oculatus TaxID=7918 RepID=W5N212_LEPOC|nr:PREDICTED: uncharacterized protein C17orf104-like isoform X1 [Lepisosteus oculatus]